MSFVSSNSDPNNSQLCETDTVVTQPMASYQKHTVDTVCPRGLEQLIDAGVIRLKQKIHVVQIICGCDMPIDFIMMNEQNQIIYQMNEEENCCVRNCVPQGFRTTSVVSNMNNAPVMRLKREARCVFNCCLPCCCFRLPFSRERLSVYGGFDQKLLGIVQQDFSAWRSRFSLLDASENTVMRIEGPGCNFACCGDIEFGIFSLDGARIGSIQKHFTGILQETFTDFDDFTITFPLNIDAGVKATLLGAVNLINHLFFQGAFRRINVLTVCGGIRGVLALTKGH